MSGGLARKVSSTRVNTPEPHCLDPPRPLRPKGLKNRAHPFISSFCNHILYAFLCCRPRVVTGALVASWTACSLVAPNCLFLSSSHSQNLVHSRPHTRSCFLLATLYLSIILIPKPFELIPPLAYRGHPNCTHTQHLSTVVFSCLKRREAAIHN